jgi:hypothetical protein
MPGLGFRGGKLVTGGEGNTGQQQSKQWKDKTNVRRGHGKLLYLSIVVIITVFTRQ